MSFQYICSIIPMQFRCSLQIICQWIITRQIKSVNFLLNRFMNINHLWNISIKKRNETQRSCKPKSQRQIIIARFLMPQNIALCFFLIYQNVAWHFFVKVQISFFCLNIVIFLMSRKTKHPRRSKWSIV